MTSETNTDSSTEITAEALIEEHGVWGAHPDFSVEDWKTEVENDDTRAGYWAWVATQIWTRDEEIEVEGGDCD